MEWNDDDRATLCRFRHYESSHTDGTSISCICKDILADIERTKFSLLWNEVKHMNYAYEMPAPIDEPPSPLSTDDDEVLEDFAINGQTTVAHNGDGEGEEHNNKCLDALVKNLTAYQ